MHIVHCLLFNLYFTLCTVYFKLYNVHGTRFSVKCTLCTILCTVYSVHYTLYTVQIWKYGRCIRILGVPSPHKDIFEMFCNKKKKNNKLKYNMHNYKCIDFKTAAYTLEM